jgi:hypothetical protein
MANLAMSFRVAYLIAGLEWTFRAAYLMVLMASLASGFLTALLSAWQTALCLQASSSTDIRLRAVSTMSKLVEGYKKCYWQV